MIQMKDSKEFNHIVGVVKAPSVNSLNHSVNL